MRWSPWRAVVCAALLAGCNAAQPQTPLATPSAPLASTILPAMTQSTETFTNPVFDQDFPDPDVLRVGDTYYAYATNSGSTNIQVAQSNDLVTWRALPDALPVLPGWAVQDFGYAWAPEVIYHTVSQRYLMYYVARYAIARDGTQCIGVATADVPEGPFVPLKSGEVDAPPLVCPVEDGGAIDPATFVDNDGQIYLLWKNDGNSISAKTWLYLQALSDDGLSLQGEATRLITTDQVWEGVLVEAPTLWMKGGRYYLFYSANTYNDRRYAVGVAVADQLRGPYTKRPEPLLKTDLAAGIVGPGGQDIVAGPGGGDWILFHGWAGGGYRRLYLAPLRLQDGLPVVDIEGKSPLPKP